MGKLSSLYHWAFAALLIVICHIRANYGIACFDCDSSKDFTCSEFWDPALDVNRQYYSDCGNVYNSQYCIKMTSIFDGKLGTKRFCSSKDWGDYCEYIKRPGDDREYRSCVFSCTSNGCNYAPRQIQAASISTLLLTAAILTRWL